MNVVFSLVSNYENTNCRVVCVGRNALEKISKASNVEFKMDRNHLQSTKVKIQLTWFYKARNHDRKLWFSEPMHCIYDMHCWQKSYSRGNGTIHEASTYQFVSLLLRYWLRVSWICRRIQGLRGSLIKTHLWLSSDRRETGRFLTIWFVNTWG
jgi:hypothetical protein